MFVFRLSVLVPVVAETEAGLNADDVQTTLSRHVDASLCVHWSLVWYSFIHILMVFCVTQVP